MCELNYADLVEKERIIIDYMLKYSDKFSLLYVFKKPYSKMPPNLENPIFAEKLKLYVLEYIFDRDKWPIKYLSRRKHQVMVMYKACKGSRQVISELPNLLSQNENEFPEDICFYRKDNPWLTTITHEKIAFMDNPTKRDISFLNENNIRFFD